VAYASFRERAPLAPAARKQYQRHDVRHHDAGPTKTLRPFVPLRVLFNDAANY
jgi:hypothetical protein